MIDSDLESCAPCACEVGAIGVVDEGAALGGLDIDIADLAASCYEGPVDVALIV